MKHRPRILMCDPEHFEVTYAINPWMLTGPVNVSRARDQWHALHAVLSQFADVSIMASVPGLPDLPFTANAGVVRGNVFVPSRFRHAERTGEEPHYTAWFRDRGFVVRTLPEGEISEGAGDALVDSEQGCLWMGHGFRSDLRAAKSLASLLDIEVVPLGLVDPRFYHLDTCFCPLPGGGAMYVPTAFDARSRSAIETRVPRSLRLTLTEEEAAAFTCNAVVLGDRIFMNRRTERVAHQLEHFGLEVHPVAMDEFIKAGGSARCLTLRLDVPAHGLRRVAEEWRASA